MKLFERYPTFPNIEQLAASARKDGVTGGFAFLEYVDAFREAWEQEFKRS